MSKVVKEIMMRDYQERLGDLEDAMVISLRGVAANDNNAIRSQLATKDIHVTVVRNKLFLQTFADSKLAKPLKDLMNFIFDFDMIKASAVKIGFDVQRMPLGQLSAD